MTMVPFDRLLGICTLLVRLPRAARSALTIEQLRSEISHDPNDKFPLLAGLISRWREGLVRPGQVETFLSLLIDLQALYLRHLPLIVTSSRSMMLAARIMAALRAMRRETRAAMRTGGIAAGNLERLSHQFQDLRNSSDALADRLSTQHAMRLEDLMRQVVDEVRHEGAAGHPSAMVDVSLAQKPGIGTIWLPRQQAEQWRDLWRNLIRNGLQATRDRHDGGGMMDPAKQAATTQAAAKQAAIPQTTATQPTEVPPLAPVRVTLSPSPSHRGTLIEIQDCGVGMEPAQIKQIWDGGVSTHGESRGWGLTEEKLGFVRRHATLDVTSEAGLGTTISIDVPPPEVKIDAPPLWRLRPVQGLILIFAALLAIPAATSLRPADVVAIEVVPDRVVQGLDADGEQVWSTDLGAVILPNRPVGSKDRPRAVRWDPAGRVQDLVIATEATTGPGMFTFLNGQTGEAIANPRLTWRPPRNPDLGKLVSYWQAALSNPAGVDQAAYVAQVRDCVHYPVSIQILNTDGMILGAYHHPGHLLMHPNQDADGDGHSELLLFGINNRARLDTSLASCPPGSWFGCALLLDPTELAGQAFPYQDWPDLAPARERAYLLIPPIACGLSPEVHRIDIGEAAPGRPPPMEIRVQDGRVWCVDSRLFPHHCYVGSNTPAAELVAAGAAPPPRVGYLERGEINVIEFPDYGGANGCATATSRAGH